MAAGISSWLYLASCRCESFLDGSSPHGPLLQRSACVPRRLALRIWGGSPSSIRDADVIGARDNWTNASTFTHRNIEKRPHAAWSRPHRCASKKLYNWHVNANDRAAVRHTTGRRDVSVDGRRPFADLSLCNCPWFTPSSWPRSGGKGALHNIRDASPSKRSCVATAAIGRHRCWHILTLCLESGQNVRHRCDIAAE